MAHGSNYKVKLRRRREQKTDYYKRYIYVINNATRLVVRRTNKYIITQIVKFSPKGDKIVVAAHSIELTKKYGWKGDTNNTPAAYLTGYLLGMRALKAGIKEVVADIGLFPSVKGNRIFTAIKGAIDAGLSVPVGEIGVKEDRIKGIHISAYAQKLESENPELFKKIFSKYLERGLNPKDLPSHFEEVLNKIKSGGA